MKNELLKIEDDLDIIYQAYESLPVLVSGSQTDSELVSPMLVVMNERLKMVIEEFSKARKTKETKKGALQLIITSSS